MQVTHVVSDNIQAYGYDGVNLYVQFKKTGAIYEYADVGESAYDAFRAAPSLGSHIHSHIKKQYIARLVSESASIFDSFVGVAQT